MFNRLKEDFEKANNQQQKCVSYKVIVPSESEWLTLNPQFCELICFVQPSEQAQQV